MNPLQYPFDPDQIIRGKKALRRELMSQDVQRLKKKIAVLGGSTTSDIVKILELFLLDAGIEPSFYESEYGQYFQDGMFPPKELLEFSPDLVFIHTTGRNISSWPALSDSPEQVEEKLRAQTGRFEAMWENIKKTFSCPIIQNNFEKPYFRVMGNRDAFDPRGRVNFTNRLNQAFYDYAREHEGFYINDVDYLSSDYGLLRWADPSYWNMYKYAMSLQAIPAFAHSVCNIIRSIFGRAKKALCLDLDNTLWGGVVGDDGADGIEIGQETGPAQAYYDFQSYLKELKSAGVLLTVCSKNDMENALCGLRHPEGVLRPEDFVLIKANWENKDLNLANTAQELNILLDSLVFADDNPAEREIVRAQLPSVSVPEMDAVENYIATIDRGGYFETASLTQDDLYRSDMYRANAQRAAQQAAFADYSEYLRSLEMRAVIGDFLPVYISRITQLTNKSNQFNLTTRRYTVEEMERIFADSSYVRLYGKLTDKFGDNGVVSVVIGKIDGSAVDIELWLMSCRVLKRDMEQCMLDQLVARCKEMGLKTLRGYYYPTAKNGMVRKLYESFGFEKLSEDSDGSTTWQLDIDSYAPKCNVIEVVNEV